MFASFDAQTDYVTLSEFLSTLGNPVRLELLRLLRLPKTLAEIRVRPHRSHTGLSAERVLARQTVQEHLDRLTEKGLVAVSTTVQGGREFPQYAVNPTSLFAFVEGLRSLSTIYAGHGAAAKGTEHLAPRPAPPRIGGPRLVLVHGVYEGKVFPLDATTGDAWTIGRASDADIRLDYDPYVSGKHAIVEGQDGRFMLHDLQARNPTHLNWEPVDSGTPARLEPGDVIGVGRSSLVFAASAR